MEYIDCWNRFFKYIIKNKIVEDVDKETLYLLLQNNLKVSLFKNKVMSCKEVIKSGARKGEECGKLLKQGEKYCKTHSKTLSKREPEDEEEEEESTKLIIRKNEYNNFVYGNTGLIFKSSLEKYIVARQGPKGEWFSLEDEDINKCKELGLRWKRIENKIVGETSNRDVLKKYDIFTTKTVEKKTFRYLDDVLEDDDKFN